MVELMFVFRVDSSNEIGSGHVMRCLSLADCLSGLGNHCAFLCRPAQGDLLEEIQRRGHSLLELPSMISEPAMSESADALESAELIPHWHVDWLIVDHYGLGIAWERAAAGFADNILVIDDIGRDHACSLLLDQNYPNPMHDRYRGTLAEAKLLIGPQYALLRAEFAASRTAALQRRTGMLVRLLVSMGGSDPGNATAKALAGLQAAWQEGWQADVVIGAGNCRREEIETMCARLPSAVIHIQTSKMAELMTTADFAIGAGGSTTWERCCLGLPALVSILSADQSFIAAAVAKTGAQSVLGWNEKVTSADYMREISALSPNRLMAMSASAAGICDGLGARRVAERLQ
jgi:UDP-2,4-diacetamido-2,4,6-trideoxy-beta-L-altropyranose hydrolase